MDLAGSADLAENQRPADRPPIWALPALVSVYANWNSGCLSSSKASAGLAPTYCGVIR